MSLFKQAYQLIASLFVKDKPIDVTPYLTLRDLLKDHPKELSVKQNGIPICLEELSRMDEQELLKAGVNITIIGRPIYPKTETCLVRRGVSSVREERMGGKWMAFQGLTIGSSSVENYKPRTAYDFLNQFYELGRILVTGGG